MTKKEPRYIHLQPCYERTEPLFPWLKKIAFLTRFLQDFFERSFKLMHFSARHLARILQGKNFLARFFQGGRFREKKDCR